MSASPAVVEHAVPVDASPSSYAHILKSSALIGGSQVLNIAIGIVRTKVMAVLLGPAGFGLMGIFAAIAELARSVAAMGINSSGVRQIAESVGSGDIHRIARTVIVLRRTAIVLGAIGALLLLLLARPISTLTFGSDAHAGEVALLSAAVFLRLVADGQGVLIQGMRRISDLAAVSVVGALLGTLISIPIVYWLREDGVVPALVAVAAAAAIASWWYARKVHIEPCAMTQAEVRHEAAALLKLGSAFMASGLLTMGAAYVVRLLVVRDVGLEAAGFYQAAWTVGGLYVGFVLQAMGADFYPRLVGAITDRVESNRLVNEQAQVSLLLAGPGVIATLTFAPLVVILFYSSAFVAAAELLRWICLGMALRVVTWPMGFIIVAQNRRMLFFATELAWTVVNVGLSWICIRTFGLDGAGIAFFGSYVFHLLMIYPIVRRLHGFRWSGDNLRTGALFAALVALTFQANQFATPPWAIGIGAVALLASGAYAIRRLCVLVPPERLPAPLRRLLPRPAASPGRAP